MTVDPTDPGTFDDQFREILGAEAPEADTAEQSAELDPADDVDPEPRATPSTPMRGISPSRPGSSG